MPRVLRTIKPTTNEIVVAHPALTVKATFVDDWTTGATTYNVTAPRVTGAFVVSGFAYRRYEHREDPDSPYVQVELGRRPPSWSYYYDDCERITDRPVINDVDLIGAPVINTDELRSQRLSGHQVDIRRPTGRHSYTCPAPPATTARAAAVIDALLTHWLTRPDNLALRLTAARRRAEDVHADNQQAIGEQLRAIAEAEQKVAQLRERGREIAVSLATPLHPDAARARVIDPAKTATTRREIYELRERRRQQREARAAASRTV